MGYITKRFVLELLHAKSKFSHSTDQIELQANEIERLREGLQQPRRHKKTEEALLPLFVTKTLPFVMQQ